MGWTLETGASSLSCSGQCMTPYQFKQTCTDGEWERTHCVDYVRKEACWCIYWQGALHLTREDTDGTMTRSSEHWLKSWGRKDGKSIRWTQKKPHPSKPHTSKKANKSLRQTAQSWEMGVDLGRKLNFSKALMPDLVVWSEGGKTILVEMTVPW